jgi:hypothetical protein
LFGWQRLQGREIVRLTEALREDGRQVGARGGRRALAVVASAALVTVAPAASTTIKLYASMSGSQEVPKKGNPRASGNAEIKISSTKYQPRWRACYSITLKKQALRDPASGAHPHR